MNDFSNLLRGEGVPLRRGEAACTNGQSDPRPEYEWVGASDGGPSDLKRERRQHIEGALKALRPEIPWTHLMDLDGYTTISALRGGKWFKKAQGLREFGEIALQLSRAIVSHQTIEGKSVLDLGCGEGGHAIMFAQAGARRVLGIDGRELAVERGRFAASVLGVSTIEFRQDDVRKLHALDEQFDIVLCSGILHHIQAEAWFPFLQNVARMTADTAIFYTHVADEQLRAEHKLIPAELEAPSNPSTIPRRLFRSIASAVRRRRPTECFRGYLYREHRDDDSADQRSSKMRASLDNTHSFWATEEALVDALRKCGFGLVFKVQSPHMFRAQRSRNTRQIIVARKTG